MTRLVGDVSRGFSSGYMAIVAKICIYLPLIKWTMLFITIHI